MNISNEDAWIAIYNLASMLGLSTSGLAKKVEVPAMVFNKKYRNNNAPIDPNLIREIIEKTGIDEQTFIKLSKQCNK